MKEIITVLFGGQSSEHTVSCMLVANVIDHIDKEKYNLLLIGITEEGHWLKTDPVEDIRSGAWRERRVEAVLSPDATEECVLVTDGSGVQRIKVDAVFPVLHGLYGEDETVQGFLELAKTPYVGCGVLASVVAIDKPYTKVIMDDPGICQATYVAVMKDDLTDTDSVISEVEPRFPHPVFVKPSSAGSSRGVSKAENREGLIAALEEAVKHDRKILMEEMIVGHEIECAVFGGGKIEVSASGVGEILAAADFYDFDAKYFSEESRTVVDPKLPEEAAERVRQAAMATFKAIDGYGIFRVGFFAKEGGEVVFNETNTIPGFTAISMYPMLWKTRDISKRELVDSLVTHTKERM